MRTVIQGSIKQRKTIYLLLFLLFILVLSLRLSQSTHRVIAQDNPTVAADDNFVFMPIVSVYRPPVYLTPQFVATVQLPNALCPGEVGVNPTTGLAYVTNHDSNNVSILQNGALQTTVTTGEWPTLVSSAPDSNKSFVTNLHGGVSYFKGTQLFSTIMPTPAFPGEEVKYGEPYATAYNPVNGYTYIIHIGGGGYVQVVNDTQTIANIPILEGWILDVKVDPATGLVYVANWEHGWMVVIQNTSVIKKFRIGWGPDKLGLDATNRYVYAAHTSPNSQYPHNISVTNLDTHQVTSFSTANSSRRVAVDPLNKLAYVTNPDADTVSVLRGPSLVGNLPTGDVPWGVAVHEASGYAFVTNKFSNTVTVLRNGKLVTTLPTGDDPIGVATDPLSNYVYVVNETSYDYCNGLNQCYKVCQQPATVTVFQIPVQQQ